MGCLAPTPLSANSPSGAAAMPLARTKSADSSNDRSRSLHIDSMRAVRFTAGKSSVGRLVVSPDLGVFGLTALPEL